MPPSCKPVQTPRQKPVIPHLPDARNLEPEPPWASCSSDPQHMPSRPGPLCCSFGSSQNLPVSKMQKSSPRLVRFLYYFTYAVVCARVFGWELLFHPSGSIEKLNCTVRFWVLKGSWSICQPHWCLTQKSISNIKTTRAIRIVYLHDKPTDDWKEHPGGKTEGQGCPTYLVGMN